MARLTPISALHCADMLGRAESQGCMIDNWVPAFLSFFFFRLNSPPGPCSDQRFAIGYEFSGIRHQVYTFIWCAVASHKCIL
ncbi:hypothetical protein BT96DRAFT_496072 [Gymnopus androsaceus JB14]|uniref:Uncharacterized protein n=1 Tax=Gymnopus androsaceus JB14 TaxID=1447944 RepID=A0A6A4HXV1_9AGAR|nr:hypothetical protein BT96DRAFT_496072 [Gymnopus androsaceus JB14]